MKKWSILVFCLLSKMAFSQVDAPVLPSIHNDTVSKRFMNNDDIVFDGIGEQQPEFIGGQKALFDFIYENLRWVNPETCLEGKVFVGFIVTKEGELTDIKVKRGIHPAFDEEAIRVLKLTSGKWKAGKQNGKPVNVAYMIPIKFRLE